MFYLEEREKRFFSILLRIFFASTFIYVPGMVLLPIAAIAAISLSLSAVIFLRDVITTHTDAFEKIKRILTLDSDSDDSEGQLLFRTENGNDSDSTDDSPSFSLRDALMLENNLHEESPLLSTHVRRQKVSFMDVINDRTRSPCVATSTDVSPTLVVDIGGTEVSSITGGRNNGSLELDMEPSTNISAVPECNQELEKTQENGSLPFYAPENAETTSKSTPNEQETENSSVFAYVPMGYSLQPVSNTQHSALNLEPQNEVDGSEVLERSKIPEQNYADSQDELPNLSAPSNYEEINNSELEHEQAIGEKIFDDILSDVVQNYLSKDDNSFDDSFIGEAFEDALKERQALPVSLTHREPFRLPPAEVPDKSSNDANEGLEVLSYGVFEFGENSSEESEKQNNSPFIESSHTRRDSGVTGQPSSTLLDNLLYMNQEDDEIERLLIEGSAERREMLHRDVSAFLEPSSRDTESKNSTSETNTPENEDHFEEIPLHQRSTDGKSLEEILDDLRSSRRLTPLQQSYRAQYESEDVQTPEQTVSFEYFLSPMPRSQTSEFEKLPPTAASVDGSTYREPNVMHRMYDRSFNAPTLTFDPDLYRPPRRRRNTRDTLRSPPSLQASPSELSARSRKSRNARPALPPATSLSARLMPRENVADSNSHDSGSFEDISRNGSADDVLEPLLLQDVGDREGSPRPRRNSASRQRSIISEMANRRKSLERSAKSIGRRAGLLKKSRSPK